MRSGAPALPKPIHNHGGRAARRPTLASTLTLALAALFATTAALDSRSLGEGRWELGTRHHPEFGQLHHSGTRSSRDRDRSELVTLATQSEAARAAPRPRELMLWLDFENEIAELLRDQTGFFRIAEANYSSSIHARMGQRSALFHRRGQRITLESPAELWPGQGTLEDFTLELSIRPEQMLRNSELFSRLGLIDGVRRGLRLSIRDERLHVEAIHLFGDLSGRRHTIELSSRSRIRSGEWHHISLSYAAASGRLALYIDGREERIAHAQLESGEILEASFHRLDRSPITIGGHFNGNIDELRLMRGVHSPERGGRLYHTRYHPASYDEVAQRLEQPRGAVTSPVYQLESSERGAASGRLDYSATEPQGSALTLYLRHSETPFNERTPEQQLPWQRVSPSSRTIDLPAFGWFQWRAELKADPTGMAAPRLESIAISYRERLRPTTPRSLRLLSELSDSRRLCIEWLANPEPEVEEQGGYTIHYGIRPGEYIGVLRVDHDGRPLRMRHLAAVRTLLANERREMEINRARITRQLENRVRLCIDNSMIIENIRYNQRQRPWGEPLPLLQAGESYYFAISAHAGGEGLESPLSSGIPFLVRDP